MNTHNINLPSTDYGRRLLPTLIDERASSEPSKPFAAIPKSSDVRDGFVDISYHELARAINRCSWWLENKLGKGRCFETVGYLGILDLRYTILMFACVKVGYKAFFTSPRNSLQAHLSLLERTECNIFILSQAAPSIVGDIVKKRQMKTISFPGLEYFLQDDAVKHYPYLKTFVEARLEPLVVLHTSGSTGIPKPVTMVHGTLSCIDVYRLIPSLGGREVAGPSWEGTRLFLAFPLFHAASMCYLLGLGVYCGVICVLPPSGVPLSASVVDQIHTAGDVQGSALPPSILVDLVREPSFQKNLWPLQYVIYAGGPLPKETGDLICSKTRLVTLTGSTEVGLPAIEVGDRNEWDYLSYSPFMGYEFRPIELDGMYEHFIVRQKNLDLFQSIFSTFPNLNEYSMQDLYEKHPTKPGLIRLRGRTDDVMSFSTAEKLNPTTMEETLNSHPGVLSALVAGHGKFQPCLVIETRAALTSEDEKEHMIEDIWPTVERANQDCPTHGRIMKDFVTFASPDKPFLRSGKGTVQRMMTLDLYKSQIDMLYEPGNSFERHLRGPLVTSQRSLLETLYQIASKTTWLKEPTYTNDLFEAGLDSMQVVALAKHINSFLRDHHPDMKRVSPATIYAHSSIAALEEALKNSTTTQSLESARTSATQRMQRLFDKYCVNLPVASKAPRPSQNEKAVVLLTGSTGFLGSHLLDRLSVCPFVSTVYCLNRGGDARERQTKSHEGNGLPARFENVKFLGCNLSQPLLGLDTTSYMELLTKVTHIIHNAWDVNFNRSVDSFDPTHIHGTRQLLDFAAASRHGARMQFISTIAAVTGGEVSLATEVQEKVYEREWGLAQDMGYAESKLVAENLVATISQASRLDALICRVGQIAGPISGFGPWTQNDWVSALIASSVSLGKIPATLGSSEMVDWLPVTTVAMSLLDLLFVAEDSACEPSTIVYHLVNPFRTSWSALLPSFIKYCKSNLEAVPFTTWLEVLQRSSTENRYTPATRLMGYFEKLQSPQNGQIARLNTTEALKVSKTLTESGPVKEDWVKHWMERWGFCAGGRVCG